LVEIDYRSMRARLSSGPRQVRIPHCVRRDYAAHTGAYRASNRLIGRPSTRVNVIPQIQTRILGTRKHARADCLCAKSI